MFAFIINWSSQASVSNWVTVFDYAGFFDLIAAVALLIPVISKSKRWEERNVQIACGIIAIIAALCWIADSKLNHRLSALQQKASDAQIGTLTNSLARTEYARNQAQIAASNAIAASGNATLQAEKLSSANARVEKLEAKEEEIRLTEKQKEAFKNALIGSSTGEFCVFFTAQDDKTVSFAAQINDLMKANGFKAAQAPSLKMIFGGLPFRGMDLEVRSPTNPPFAGNIQQAFKRMGFNASGSTRNPSRGFTNDLNMLFIVVGVQDGGNPN